MATWTFLSNHALVLLSIARDPGIRLRQIGEQVGITERAAHRIVTELIGAGYVERERRGRRNHYGVAADRSLPDPLPGGQTVGDLLRVLELEPAVDGVSAPTQGAFTDS
jgi:hypothetical protein